MSNEQLITSAALYFASETDARVPLHWYERVCDFFNEYNLPKTFFSASGGRFRIDEPHHFVDQSMHLLAELRKGAVRSLDVESARSLSGPRSDWRAATFVWAREGVFFVGVESELIGDPLALLCRAYDILKGLLPVRYGIAYRWPLSHHPDCHAFGRRPTTVSEFREKLRARREGTWQTSPDEVWFDELRGQRRHLSGLFRGAYLANILSESHLSAADLRSRMIGTLSPLDKSLWVWELSPSEQPLAENLLASAGALLGK